MGDWKNWVRGILSAGIGGAANALLTAVIDPMHFSVDGWKYAGGGALIAVAMYLKQSPLPPEDKA